MIPTHSHAVNLILALGVTSSSFSYGHQSPSAATQPPRLLSPSVCKLAVNFLL